MSTEIKEIKEYVDLRFLIALNDGKKLRRIDWSKNHYIQLLKLSDSFYIRKVFTLDNIENYSEYRLSGSDLFTSRWIENVQSK